MYGGGSVYFYHHDHLNTPQTITDESGTIVWDATYKSFGETNITTETVSNNFRFPGQYYDQESGLHYNYHRYYDSSTGRYLKEDPIGIEGGINLYLYVEGNPVNFIDPLGLVWYGNYCGPGGSGEPVDCYDSACKAHDECYEKCGVDAKTRWYPENLLSDCAWRCDKKLAKDFKDCASCDTANMF